MASLDVVVFSLSKNEMKKLQVGTELCGVCWRGFQWWWRWLSGGVWAGGGPAGTAGRRRLSRPGAVKTAQARAAKGLVQRSGC